MPRSSSYSNCDNWGFHKSEIKNILKWSEWFGCKYTVCEKSVLVSVSNWCINRNSVFWLFYEAPDHKPHLVCQQYLQNSIAVGELWFVWYLHSEWSDSTLSTVESNTRCVGSVSMFFSLCNATAT